MFSKHSRLLRSSSLGGSTDLLNPVWSIGAPRSSNGSKPVVKNADPVMTKKLAVARPAVVLPQPQKSIFTLSSPPHDERTEDRIREWSKNFLDACALCKKKIPHNEDRYMYGYLQAFCSNECRDDKIVLDGESSPPSQVREQTHSTLRRTF